MTIRPMNTGIAASSSATMNPVTNSAIEQAGDLPDEMPVEADERVRAAELRRRRFGRLFGRFEEVFEETEHLVLNAHGTGRVNRSGWQNCHPVVPAKAGTHFAATRDADRWIPAFAGR